MKRALLVLAVALSAAAPARAVTLLDPSTGQPVGGVWQARVDHSRAPTVRGPLAFTADASVVDCGGPQGCSAPDSTYLNGLPLTVVYPTPRSTLGDTLGFELGHQFAWRYMRDPRDRAYFTWHLRLRWESGRRAGLPAHLTWDDTAAGAAHGNEDGVEAYFASVYGDCFNGRSDNGWSFVLIEPTETVPDASPDTNLCTFIQRVGREHGADMAASSRAWWNRHHHRHRRHHRRYRHGRGPSPTFHG